MDLAHFDIQTMISFLQENKHPRVAVVGDYCLDCYLYRDKKLDEPSVETGLFAWQIRSVKNYAGVGGTIAANLLSLGAKVCCVGLRGNDGYGFELAKALEKLGACTAGMIVSDSLITNTYIKPMVQENATWVEMNRIDIRNSHSASEELVTAVIEKLAAMLPQLDAVIVSDQFTFESGSVVTDSFRESIATLAKSYPNVLFLGDSRSNLGKFRQIMVKGNASEVLAWFQEEKEGKEKNVAPDVTADHRDHELLLAGRALACRNGQAVLITRGAQGAILFEPKYSSDDTHATLQNRLQNNREEPAVTLIPAIPVAPPLDICGAGDATNAGFVFGCTIGLTSEQAALLAMVVSSITIRQIGVTGTARVEQVIDVLQSVLGQFPKSPGNAGVSPASSSITE